MISTIAFNTGAIPEIDTREGLARASGKTAVYTQILRMFRATHAGDPDRLQELLDREDWKGARRLVHTLKGTAGNIGARRLFRTCQKVEKEVAGRVSQIDYRELALDLGQVVEGIGQWLDQPDEAPERQDKQTVSWEEWSAMVKLLLRQGNLRAAGTMDLVSRDMRDKAPGLFTRMEEKLERYRFDEALGILEILDEKMRCAS